jgi:hypothetical protein
VEPAFRDAVANSESLIVDMDGTWGVGPSFREETFGGLVRHHLDSGEVYDYRSVLSIKSDEDDDMIELAWSEIDKMVKKYKPKSHS